ncbi:unannotated protein [freshwater metagenome]|uniref:Unannotated protein n=1 Tax=freshwater metagenome TaxID=449393 RepID=A0A6J7JM55_9ZZZZ
MLLPLHEVCFNIVEAAQHFHFRVNGKTEPAEELKNLVMFSEFWSADNFAKLITPERKVATGRHRCILLTKRTSRGISRIDVSLVPRFNLRCIQFVERRDRHVDLAANFKNFGTSFRKPVRNAGDRLHVCSDILANATVTASCRLHQDAVFISD